MFDTDYIRSRRGKVTLSDLSPAADFTVDDTISGRSVIVKIEDVEIIDPENVIAEITTVTPDGESNTFIGKVNRKLTDCGHLIVDKIHQPSDPDNEGHNGKQRLIAVTVIAGAIALGSLHVWHKSHHD